MEPVSWKISTARASCAGSSVPEERIASTSSWWRSSEGVYGDKRALALGDVGAEVLVGGFRQVPTKVEQVVLNLKARPVCRPKARSASICSSLPPPIMAPAAKRRGSAVKRGLVRRHVQVVINPRYQSVRHGPNPGRVLDPRWCGRCVSVSSWSTRSFTSDSSVGSSRTVLVTMVSARSPQLMARPVPR